MKKISQKKKNQIDKWLASSLNKSEGKVDHPDDIRNIDTQILSFLGWRPKRGQTNPLPSFLKIERQEFYDNSDRCCFNFEWGWIHLALPHVTEALDVFQGNPAYLPYTQLVHHVMTSNIDMAYRKLGVVCGILNIIND